jgi:two-component system phosphate regulon sensor histidine kinase PhoR
MAAVEFGLQPAGSFLDWLIFRVPINALIERAVTVVLVGLAAIVVARYWRNQESTITPRTDVDDKYASLLRSLPVGVYRMAADGRILEANDQFAKILGFHDGTELKGAGWNLNEFCINKVDRQKQLEKLREGPAFAEFQLRRMDERTIWIRDYPRATLNADGSIAYIDGVCVEMHEIDGIMRDIAEHRKLQRMKEHFIIAVTHELRTPLVSIKGYVDHILAKEPSLSEGLRAQVEIVRRNADRLLQLTDDLLNLEETETGHLDLKVQPLVLREAVAECVEEIQPLIREKGIELKLEIPGNLSKISADPLRLMEILMNILENAVKFTPSHGEITIRVEESDSTITVSITDTGIGIDPKDLERVFEPFAVIDKPGYFKGTGLGLSLAKKLVEAHGGRLWASSVGKGRGSTFYFTLPKKEEEWLMAHG